MIRFKTNASYSRQGRKIAGFSFCGSTIHFCCSFAITLLSYSAPSFAAARGPGKLSSFTLQFRFHNRRRRRRRKWSGLVRHAKEGSRRGSTHSIGMRTRRRTSKSPLHTLHYICGREAMIMPSAIIVNCKPPPHRPTFQF